MSPVIPPFPPEVTTFFSDRSVDFTLDKNQPGFTQAQQRYLEKVFPAVPTRIAQIQQVHGDRIKEVKAEDFPWPFPLPEADALITAVPGIGLTVRTADCLPVFLYEPVRRVIALVHAGWRSTHQQIVAKTVTLMQARWGSQPQNVTAAFGPAIRACCFEVSPEFKQFFPNAVQQRDGKLFFDLKQENCRQLEALGVLHKDIHDPGLCTACDPRFYSFRREKEQAGRHLSLMCLREES